MIPMGRHKFKISHNMKMVGIMLILTRALCFTEKAVILDSVSVSLNGFYKLLRGGFMEGHLIKKRWYWSRGIHGDGIN